MGSGALNLARTFYLCYRRGDGTPLTSVYPVSGAWFENRDCDDGDQRVSSTNLNSGSIQEATCARAPAASIRWSTST